MREKSYSLRGLELAPITQSQLVDYIERHINANIRAFCVALNLDVLRVACDRPSYYRSLKTASIAYADGMPLVWLSRLEGADLPEKVTGSEVVNDLCRLSHEKGYRIFMLGAAEGVAERAKQKLESKLPDINIVGTYSPAPNELQSESASDNIINYIKSTGTQILFVALGAPKQEEWIVKNMHKFPNCIILPCGGSIDYIAGVQKTSPRWIANLGFEWLYRMLHNPGRLFRRYIVDDLPFFGELLYEVLLVKPLRRIIRILT